MSKKRPPELDEPRDDLAPGDDANNAQSIEKLTTRGQRGKRSKTKQTTIKESEAPVVPEETSKADTTKGRSLSWEERRTIALAAQSPYPKLLLSQIAKVML